MPAEMCLGEPVAVKWPFSSVSSCAQAVGGSGETVKSLQGWCLAPRPSKQRAPRGSLLPFRRVGALS